METSQEGSSQQNQGSLDWDASESTVTAWSVAASKRRRVYGQKGTFKSEAQKRNNDADQKVLSLDTDGLESNQDSNPELKPTVLIAVSDSANTIPLSAITTTNSSNQLKITYSPNSLSTKFMSDSARCVSSSLIDLAWEGAKENRERIFSMSDTDAILVNGSPSMVKCSPSGACLPSLAPTTFSMLAKSRSQSPMDWMKFSGEEEILRKSELLSDLSSPAKSTGSSRKRQVPNSPEMELASSIGGFSMRSRSRSRILSPSPERKISLLDTSPKQDPDVGRNKCAEESVRSKERTDHSSSDESNAESDSSGESFSSVNSDSDDDSVGETFVNRSNCLPSNGTFGPSSCFGNDNMTSNHRKIFDSMSSYGDLKFLIKCLRRERDAKDIQFGFVRSWSVVPPIWWPHSRKLAFRRWITDGLGFTLRVGGGAVVFFQISTLKGKNVLDSLEKALISYKASTLQPTMGLEGDSATNIEGRDDDFADDTSFCHHTRKGNRSDFEAEKEMAIPQINTQLDLSAEGWTIDTELTRGLKSLDLSRPFHQSAAPLLRHVTLDHHESQDVWKPDNNKLRNSSEHHVPVQDFMLQLHGFTPTRNMSRPPRMSNSSVSSVAGRIVASSPFVLPHNSVTRKSNVCSASFEFVETPLVKQVQGWGSRPVFNRDWGATSECFDEILRDLLDRVDVAEDLEDQSTTTPRYPKIEKHACSVVSANLGFELEVHPQSEESNEGKPSDTGATFTPRLLPHKLERRGSVGATAFAGLSLDPHVEEHKHLRRRLISFAKHKRMSLCAAILNPLGSQETQRTSLFAHPSRFEHRHVDRASPLNVHSYRFSSKVNDRSLVFDRSQDDEGPKEDVFSDVGILIEIFSYLGETELLHNATAVCKTWAEAGSKAHANTMLASIGCAPYFGFCEKGSTTISWEEECLENSLSKKAISAFYQRDWNYLVSQYPWACFLGDGAFKRVYKVWNSSFNCYEALSLMDIDAIDSTGGLSVLGAELAVSAMVTSLVRRAICPNFVSMRGIFTCQFEPPTTQWGCPDNKVPRGSSYNKKVLTRKPRIPASKHRGNFQYIRMELCDEGDAEEYLKRQTDEAILPTVARMILFQITFALYAAAARIHLKHYDVKLLNVFLQAQPARDDTTKQIVLRYGVGSKTFALRMKPDNALVAKLADFGTANVDPHSIGCPVTMAQFTTLENSPPEFMYLGDAAKQGHGHDAFCLGLCMLHLFTGHAPYEEILCDVKCPPCLRKKLSKIWEDEKSEGYSVLRDIILANVYKDEEGRIVEGEPDDTMYDTFYRYLVLFGIPTSVSMKKDFGKVWRAVDDVLVDNPRCNSKTGKGRAPLLARAADLFAKHRSEFSIVHGCNKYIMRARRGLESMDGGMDLLLSLVSFDPASRATFLDVLNSSFMEGLQEETGTLPYTPCHDVRSFTAFSC